MGAQAPLAVCTRGFASAITQKFGVKDKDIVEVRIDSEGRDLIFGDVLVRVSKKYVLEMHIDTDEANAAEIQPGMSGVLASTIRFAQLRVLQSS